MKRYKVFLRLEAADALRGIRPKRRGLVAKFLEFLAEDPFQEGDYSEKDNTLRKIEFKIIGQYAITFWTDHPVEEVKVADIRKADRP